MSIEDDSTVYQVLTPYGNFTATFLPDDEDDNELPVVFAGDEAGIQYVRNLLDIGIVGDRGHTLSEQGLSPDTLYRFLPTETNGIIILEPIEMMEFHLNRKKELGLD